MWNPKDKLQKYAVLPHERAQNSQGAPHPEKRKQTTMFFHHGKRRRPLRRHLLCAVACGTGLALLCGCSAEPADSRGSEPGAADEAGRTEASSVTRDTDGTETSGPSQAVISRAPYMPS